MVYSSLDNNGQLSSLALTNTIDRNVRILYNNYNIHSVTSGNVPLMTINENSNTNENGELYSSTVNLTLNGKILANNQGTTGVLSCYNELVKLFYGTGVGLGEQMYNGYNGVLQVQCGTSNVSPPLFSATGVRVKNISLDPSPDNWVLGANYTVELEYHVPRALYTGYYVKNTSDDWTIEPLEDYVYSTWSGISPSRTRQEFHNPLLKSNAATESAPQPTSPPATIFMYTIPQYKISRKLAAVGLPRFSGVYGTHVAYQEAQKWVTDRLKLTYKDTGVVAPHISLENSAQYLYNHLRTTSFNIQAGSYEANDTWLAMPVSIPYTEDYTVETSTDEAFNKVVKIAGSIKGLVKANSGVASGISGIIPDQSLINLSGALYAQPENMAVSTVLRDADGSSAGTVGASPINIISSIKYYNANSGWLYDIKPYLYRRAGLVMNTLDRAKSVYNPTNLSIPPNDPTISYERPLNPNPMSSSETHDPRKGTINYSYEFNNKMKYFNETVAENITISDDNPVDVVNEAFVLGRRLGPVLQGLGTVTSAKKTINVEVMVVPPSSIHGYFMSNPNCPLYIYGSLYTGIDKLIEQLKPFGDHPTTVFGPYGTRSPAEGDEGALYIAQDSHSWDPTEGTYKRTVQYVYQHCTTSELQMDY